MEKDFQQGMGEAVNKKRRKQIAEAEKECRAVRRKVVQLHDDEYGYREHLWKKGQDESDTADVSDASIDALSRADTLLMRACLELAKAMFNGK